MATKEQQTFIDNIYKYVAKYAPQYGVKCYSAIIAQAICESGWGKSKLSAKYHNYFGLKCGTLWKGSSVSMRTGEEYTPGVHTTITDNFRVYKNMEEGVKGYFIFLFDGRTRYNNLKGVTDPQTYLQKIKSDGYATSSTYVQTNMNLVNSYGLRKYDPGNSTKTDTAKVSQRQAVIDVFESWVGKKEADGSHKEIIDIYNKYLSTAVKFGTLNYRVSSSDSWCATAVSAAFIKAGLASLCPIECSCPRQIALAKKMGIWVEKDSTVPEPGWIIEYDWQDSSGSGDNTGVADHVGLIVSVDKSAGEFLVIEGNKNDAVGYRNMAINGRYIRGFAAPKYTDEDVSPVTPAKPVAPSNIETVAMDVMQGLYGNGDDRVNALKKAGYDPTAVQSKVNELVKKYANKYINGDAGNGTENRIAWLRRQGFTKNPAIANEAIQSYVNKIA